MATRLKATAAAAAVAVAGLMVLAICFGALNALFPSKPDYTKGLGQVRIEMMPESSPVYLERHYPGPNGKDIKTETQYRNGDLGVKIYRADNTLAEWTIDFPTGGTRLHAVFAGDGKQVILGEEFRADRTLKWTATNTNDVVTLTTYYYDGNTAFSVVQRKIGADSEEARYFRKDGKLWIHQIAGVSNTTNLQLQEVWDKDGHQLYVRRAVDKDGKSIDVTYFREDGTAKITQHWVEHTYSGYGWGGGYDDGYYYPSSNTVLKSVDELGADGRTVSRHIDFNDDGSSITTVTEYATDGTSVMYSVTSNEVTHVDKKDKDGRVTHGSDTKPGEVKLNITDDLTRLLPTSPEPVEFWQAQEKDPSVRGEDAP